jgi:hypothetical protein
MIQQRKGLGRPTASDTGGARDVLRCLPAPFRGAGTIVLVWQSQAGIVSKQSRLVPRASFEEAAMFLRCTRSTFDPAKADDVAAIGSELKALFATLPGIQHSHTALDRATGKAITITLFDTREHAQFSREALGDIVARFHAAGVKIEAAEFYETV